MKLLNLLRYVTLAQWRQHALRTVLTTIGLALGVAVIVAMRLVNGTVFASIRDSVDDVAGRAVLSVTNGQAGVPEELLDRVRAVPGVKAAAALILDSGLVLDHAQKGERLQVFGVDYLADSQVRSYDLDKTGDDDSQMDDPIVVLSRPDSVFVTRDFATTHTLELGSPLRIQTARGPRDLVVRGILKDAGPAKAFGGMLALMDIYAAQLAFGKGVAGEPGRFDQIDVVLDPALDDATGTEIVRARIAAAVAGSATVAKPESRGEQMASLLGATKLGFAQAQALAFIVGVFLVFNTMSIAVVQRRREIGLLRSLGTAAPTIRALFLIEAALLSALGSTLGLGGGLWIARTIVPAIGRLLSAWVMPSSVKVAGLGTPEVVAALGAGIGVSLVATLIPSVQAGRVSPLVALRRDAAARVEPRTIARLGLGGLIAIAASFAMPALSGALPAGAADLGSMGARLLGAALVLPWVIVHAVPLLGRVLEAWFGIQGRLAGDNLRSAPGRTSVTLTAILVGIAAYVIVATLMHSLEISLDDWLDHYIASDLSVAASSRVAGPSSNRIPGFLVDGIRELPGVRIVRPFRSLQIPYRGDITVLLSLDLGVARRTARYHMLEGPDSWTFQEMIHRGEGVGVSDAFARHFGKHPGDTIELETPTGPHSFRILGTFADWAGPTGSIHVDRSVFVRDWKSDLVDGISVDLTDPSQEARVMSAIRERYGTEYDLQVMTSREVKGEIRSQVVQGFQMTRATEVVVLLISALGVVNTLLAAVLDRTREIGILRATGATRAQIVNAVLLEAGLLGTLGAVAGVSLGLATSYPFVCRTLIEQVGWHVDFHVDARAVATAAVLAIAISVIAAYHPARKAARLDVLSAIEYE